MKRYRRKVDPGRGLGIELWRGLAVLGRLMRKEVRIGETGVFL